MASITLRSYKCSGRLCNLTQNNIRDTTIILELKYGNQWVKKSHAKPQKHGPTGNIYSQSSHDTNFTMKNHLEKR